MTYPPIEGQAHTPFRGIGACHPALAPRHRELFQLAGEWRGGVPAHGTWLEQKHDGIRVGWIDGRLLTREGAEIHGTGHIAHKLQLIEREYGEPLFFDGEFVVAGSFRETQAHFARGPRVEEAGTLWLFDCLTAAEWRADDCDRQLIDRRAMLEELVAIADGERLSWEWREGTRGRVPSEPPLSLVTVNWMATQADVEALTASVWAAGGEGVMLKDAEAPYHRLRSNAWQKYKRHGWATRSE